MKAFAALGLLLSLMALPVAADERGASCAPDGQTKFVCGIEEPEDLLPLPGGKWIVTSGLTIKSGLHLIDLKTKKAERWLPGPMQAAAAPYQTCPSPPIADEIQAHGISVRDRGQGRATVYVVNHGGPTPFHFAGTHPVREAIEVFDADMNNAKPTLTWVGCVTLPLGLVANSVTSTPDGAILLTVVLHPGMSAADYIAGRPTGAVYRWQPGETGFSRLWGTEFTGNNGLETSADGKTLYIAAKDGLRVVSNANPSTPLQIVTLEGIVDNVHWSDGKLIVAGVKHRNDPDCADMFKAAAGVLGEKCLPGYFAAAVDPVTFKVTPLTAGAASKTMNGITAGITTGKTLWLSSMHTNRIAYLRLQ